MAPPLSEDFPTPTPPPPDKDSAEDMQTYDGSREIEHLRSSQEGKRVLFALIEALLPFSPQSFTDHEGRRVTALVSQIGDGDSNTKWPFTITQVDSQNSIEISDGTIWIFNADETPELGGNPVSDDPAPTLAAVAGDKVWLVLELTPTAAGSAPNKYVDGFDTMVSADFELSATSQTPTVDGTSGAVTANGIFSIYIGTVGAARQNRYGPLSISSCDTGTITVDSPTYTFYTIPS